MYDKFDKYLIPLNPKLIVEVGFHGNTLELASYAERYGCEVHSVDLNVNRLKSLHDALENVHLAPFVALHLQEPTRFLLSKSWIDAVFLFGFSGLQATLDETKLAMSAGANLIVSINYQQNAAWAVQFAKQSGWSVVHEENTYSYMMRPK